MKTRRQHPLDTDNLSQRAILSAKFAPLRCHRTAQWLAIMLAIVLPATPHLLSAQAVPTPPPSKAPPATQDDPTDAATTSAPKQRWFGVLDAKDRKFRFVVEITNRRGALQGTLLSLDEGGRKFDLSDVTSDAKQLSFTLPLTKASYASTVAADGRSRSGKWTQRGNTLRLDFQRTESIPKRPIAVIWKGTLNAFVQKLDVAFIILESGEIYFDSISQSVGGFVVTQEKSDVEGEIIFAVKAVQGTFRGRYSEDKAKLEGKWKQGLMTLPLSLVKAEAAELVTPKLERPQTPRAPFPYQSYDVKAPSQDGSHSLAGTITLPQKPRAAVVLISGSGPQDRDETLLNHKPFWVIADHFARNGIATIRYDDRGVGKSTGNFDMADSLDFPDDAEAVVNFLKSHKPLADLPVGLCGHSEGGLIAPIVAARSPHVTFAILMAGTGVNGEEILYNQLPRSLRAEGVEEAKIQESVKTQQAIVSTIKQHPQKGSDELLKLASASVAKALEQDTLNEESEAGVKAAIEKMTNPWFRTFMTLEPTEALKNVTCPVLAINGGKDVQVDPELNLPAIEAALREGGNAQVAIKTYPNLNHLFQAAKTGGVSEYVTITETFNLKPLKDMTSWILEITQP